MTIKFFIIVVVGKLLIHLVSNLPYAKTIKIKPFDYLFQCDLCLGFWIYFSLFAFYGGLLQIQYVPVATEVITAALVSYIMHLASLGWKIKYGVFE